MDMALYRLVQRWSGELDGVFTLPDLRVVLGDRTEAAMYKRIAALLREGVLLKVKPGLYATPEADLAVISSRIDPEAYISTGTILARAAVIGSVPVGRVQAVKRGRPRTYHCKLGTIEHFSISPRLYFGFESADGMLQATVEKAFLDVCYYTYRGQRFSFDPATDVSLVDLDRQRIEHYLAFYDPRFMRYFERIWGSRW